MNIFRTPVEVPDSLVSIKPSDRHCFLGSCFADNISRILSAHAFDVLANPSGMLFNPLSICRTLYGGLTNKAYDASELEHHGGHYFSFDFDTSFYASDPDVLLEKINNTRAVFHDYLRATDFLWITFGSSFVYHHKKCNHAVVNCHKLPAVDFMRYRLSVEEVVRATEEAVSMLRKVNPAVTIVFTVSPVRHWKDGAHDNQLSKSILLLAQETLCRKLERCIYFPAYEIMLDELRDYRFYKEDMLHPSDLALTYIFEKIRSAFFDSSTALFYEKTNKIRKSLDHRPLYGERESSKMFAQTLQKQILALQETYGKPVFQKELTRLMERFQG